jgi:hypothetical protein
MTCRPACLLLHDSRNEQPPLIARQYALLRRFDGRIIDLAAGASPSICAQVPRTTIIAMSARSLAMLGRHACQQLAQLVHRGATLYVRGGFGPGGPVEFTSLGLRFETSELRESTSYRLASGPLIPSAFENETGCGRFEFRHALRLDEPFEPLIVAGGVGNEQPVCFAIRYHDGVVICDLQDDVLPEAAGDAPIIERLGVPAMRVWEISALIAVEHACERDFKLPVPFNIVLDDRPANFDFFRTGRLEKWLAHLTSLMPDACLDFAWIPSQTRPPHSYVEMAEKFRVNFVWHGLNRHTDHSELIDIDGELARGRANVDEISRRYGVCFQSVMIFPFERHNPAVIDAVHRAGFIASFENPFTAPNYESALPKFLRMSTPMQPLYGRYFPIFRRFSARLLDRDRMLALSALRMPVIATVHPGGVGLGRPFRSNKTNVESVLDQVVGFAAEKKLRPLSLAAIAQEMID